MDSVLLQSPTAVQSLAGGPLADPNFHSMLKDSIDRYLIEVQKENSDFSSFRSIFLRLLQSSVDPPLEVLWFYSAISFHEAIRSKCGVLARVLAVKDLLQLLSACAASFSGSKSIALLAPAVSELYHCVKDEANLSGKEKKMVRMEIESLVEGIVSYISICCGKSSVGRDSSSACLLPCFLDLVRVWTAQHSEGVNGLRVLFPLVSDDIYGPLGEEKCGIGYLAGVVITEAFLLRLTLKVSLGQMPRSELQKELTIGAVSSISAFRNAVFFDILLKLLLHPPLPVISLASAADESLVRDVLYDAVILLDYSFINLDESITSIVVRRLIVTHEAIRLARDIGDCKKATAYVNAFCTSCIPNSLIKWISNHVGSKKLDKPSSITPQALLEWLVGLEERGITVFEDHISKLCRKLVFEESKVVSEGSLSNSESKRHKAAPFFLDNKGGVPEENREDKDMELVDSAFHSAARSMRSDLSKGRKRKEWGNEQAKSKMKSVKYKIHDNLRKDYFSSSAADAQSGSEVENPVSDEEMEEMVQ